MPVARIRNKHFAEKRVFDEYSFMAAFGRALRERGFQLDLPMDRSFGEEESIFTQEEPPGRIPNNNPQLWSLLQRVARADATAVQAIAALLLAEGDNRYDVLESLGVDMPAAIGPAGTADMGIVGADFGTASNQKVAEMVPAQMVVERILCAKVLLLFGLREETI